jgi:hypothetical protein
MTSPQNPDLLAALRRIVQRFDRPDNFDPDDLAILRNILLGRIAELEAGQSRAARRRPMPTRSTDRDLL